MRVRAAGVLALALALAGCASPADTLGDQAAAGLGAVETALLAVELDRDGRSTYAVTSTSLTDALGELTDASRTTAELDAATATEEAVRAETADALRQGTDAVNAARSAMHGVGSLAAASDDLERASEVLESLAKELGAR